MRYPKLLLTLVLGAVIACTDTGVIAATSRNYKLVHLTSETVRHGLLTIAQGTVSYVENEDASDNFSMPCRRFVTGLSVRNGPDGALLLPTNWVERGVRSDEELTTDNLAGLVKNACEGRGKSSSTTAPDTASHKVWRYDSDHRFSPGEGWLTVRGGRVIYHESNRYGYSPFHADPTCHDFLGRTTFAGTILSISDGDNKPLALVSDTRGVSTADIYQDIFDACKND
jgi:hypothetical protein